MTTKVFDIIICGAGPAGSTCAIALAKSGLKVAVIEKNSFPREKVCGDLVGAYVPKVLNTLGAEYKDAFLNFEKKTILNAFKIIAPNNKTIEVKLKENAYMIKRFDFDNLLYELAAREINISFFLNHEISDVYIDEKKEEANVVANHTLFKAKLVIGCDGAQSMVARKLTNTKKDLNHHAAAVRAYFKNVSETDDHKFELHFLDNLEGGYFWIFSMGDNLCNVGVGALSSSISKKKINLRDEMKNYTSNYPHFGERFKHAEMVGKIEGYGLPMGSRRTTMSGNYFMLCGDAASLINPLTGEGIGQAIVSGRYAGWQAKKCFNENNFSASFMKEYDKMIYNKIIKENKRAYRIQKLITNQKWLFKSIFNIVKNNSRLEKLIQSLIS